MKRLTKLFIIACVLATVGSLGWWFVGAGGQQAALTGWLEKQRDRGWQAEAAVIDISGFPLDFNTRITDLRLADPKTGWSWSAPTLAADSKSFQPTRINVTWPTSQIVAVPGEQAEISANAMTSVIDLRPGPSMELREISSEISALAIAAQSGWKASAASADIDISERSEDLAPPNSYDLRLVAAKVKLPKNLVANIDPTGWLKPSVEAITVKGHAAFDNPIDRSVVEDGRLALRAATIREAGFEWGDMQLVVKGAIEVDDDGFPVGNVDVQAKEWRQMLRLATSSGAINRKTAKSVRKAVEFLTSLTGSGDNLSMPLALSGRKVRIGPFAIANAPRLAPPR